MTTLCQPCEPLGKLLVRKWSRVSRGEQVDLKTGEMPKQSTIEKYNKDVEIKEVMEEVVFCQPCEKEFYKKGKHWYCLCDKRIDRCSNTKCKTIGLRLGLKVGGGMCEHNKRRSTCKGCDGSQICEHNRDRSYCKDCGGSAICEHNRRRSICKECDGSQICEHNKQRSQCKDCGGGSICEHNKQRSYCKECGGGSICEHNKHRSYCKECGGASICEHNKRRSRCKLCKGGEVCKHNIQRSQCKICDPQGHIANLRRTRRRIATYFPNPTHTLDDLCMTPKEWLKYLHKTFEDRYGRPKTEKDEVHIDEIIPCSAWNLPDDNKYCWHYLNSQWLLAEDNLSKHDSYSQTDKDKMIKRIDIALSEIKTRVSI